MNTMVVADIRAKITDRKRCLPITASAARVVLFSVGSVCLSVSTETPELLEIVPRPYRNIGIRLPDCV